MSFLTRHVVVFTSVLTCFSVSQVYAASESPEIELRKEIRDHLQQEKSIVRRYQLEKADAWLTYAIHEASERGFTRAGEEAFDQAQQLLNQRSDNLVTPIISVSQVMRRDLWWQLEYAKQQGRLESSSKYVAGAEVLLVWAAAEYCELGWRHAQEHFDAAERYVQKVIYNLPMEQRVGFEMGSMHLPDLNTLNGKGCQGVNIDAWPLNVPQKLSESTKIFDEKPSLKIENVVHFALDQSKLNQEGESVLDRIVELMTEYSDLSITLMGYTDIRASVAYNLALSQRRIDTVRAYLQQKGIKKNRIAEQPKGKVELIEDEQQHIGHAKSRRVVIHFHDADAQRFDVQPQWRDLQIEK